MMQPIFSKLLYPKRNKKPELKFDSIELEENSSNDVKISLLCGNLWRLNQYFYSCE